MINSDGLIMDTINNVDSETTNRRSYHHQGGQQHCYKLLMFWTFALLVMMGVMSMPVLADDSQVLVITTQTPILTSVIQSNHITGDNVKSIETIRGSVDSLSTSIKQLASGSSPTFTIGEDQSVLEDAGAQTVIGFIGDAQPGIPGQTVSFIVDNNNPTLFITVPEISSDGTLSYTPANNANGSTIVSVSAVDDGGVDVSAEQSFMITVTAVNDAPTFSVAGDQIVEEDAGSQIVQNFISDINAGPNENQNLTLNTMTSTPLGLFSAGPNIDASGNLIYTPAPNANGIATFTFTLMDDGGIANGGVNVSIEQTATITVISVNDPPTFSINVAVDRDQSILEDAGQQSINSFVTDISPGAGESGQSLTFITNTSNTTLFSEQPVIDPIGNLTYTPAADTSGMALVTITLMDDGGSNNGGVAVSAEETFMIEVLAVNDAPSFTIGPDQNISEDAGTQSISGFASNISAGPNELGQNINFLISNNNSALFSQVPTIDINGNLSYMTAPDINGSATVTVTLTDDGGDANGGSDSSLAQAFSIIVSAVNDAPEFTLGDDQMVLEGAGPQQVDNFVSDLSAGPADEVGQSLVTSIIDISNNAIFNELPSIDTNGNLSYTADDQANGIAIVSVQVMDDGGTVNAGVDTTVQVFMIEITPVNDEPSFTIDPLVGGDQMILEDAGIQTISGFVIDISAGDGEPEQTVSFLTNTDNDALFSILPAISADGILTYTPTDNASGTTLVSVMIMDDGGVNNGGVSISEAQTFTLEIIAVNDAPEFVIGPDQVVLEGAGPQQVDSFISDLNAGPADESGQLLTISILDNSNEAFFSDGPNIDANGDLTYTTTEEASGTAIITVQVMDDGGVENTGVNSSSQTFMIDITLVNDAPSFTLGANQTVFALDPAQTVTGFVTNISPGGENETDQNLSFIVSADISTLFAVQPAIDADGNLTYAPALGEGGLATVSVVLMDDGGIENGGINISGLQNFTIDILGDVADLAVTKTNGAFFTDSLDMATYIITVTNTGNSVALGAQVIDTLGDALDETTATWTCVPSAGASCTAAGNGNIDDFIDIPDGGVVIYTLTAAVIGNEDEELVNTVTVISPATPIDPDLSNNTATDIDLIALFADGFETP